MPRMQPEAEDTPARHSLSTPSHNIVKTSGFPKANKQKERLLFRISNPELDVFQDTQKEIPLADESIHRVAEQEGPEILT